MSHPDLLPALHTHSLPLFLPTGPSPPFSFTLRLILPGSPLTWCHASTYASVGSWPHETPDPIWATAQGPLVNSFLLAPAPSAGVNHSTYTSHPTPNYAFGANSFRQKSSQSKSLLWFKKSLLYLSDQYPQARPLVEPYPVLSTKHSQRSRSS